MAQNWRSAGDLGRLGQSPEQLGRQETRELNRLVHVLRGPGECEMEMDKQVFFPIKFPKHPFWEPLLGLKFCTGSRLLPGTECYFARFFETSSVLEG